MKARRWAAAAMAAAAMAAGAGEPSMAELEMLMGGEPAAEAKAPKVCYVRKVFDLARFDSWLIYEDERGLPEVLDCLPEVKFEKMMSA